LDGNSKKKDKRLSVLKRETFVHAVKLSGGLGTAEEKSAPKIKSAADLKGGDL